MFKFVIVAILSLFALSDAGNPKMLEPCFPAVEHVVTTSDGYIISIFQLNTAASNVAAKHESVVLAHGLLANGNTFNLLRKKSISCMLAHEGYDVWIINHRGTNFGERHTSLQTNTKEFWDFSWHEIGRNDLPDILDFILTQSSQTQLHYIGFSEGSSILLVLLFTNPQYNQKLKSVQFVSPGAFLSKPGNIQDVLVGNFVSFLYNTGLLTWFGVYEVDQSAPMPELTRLRAMKLIPPAEIYINQTCYNTIIFDYSKSSSSLKELIHFIQLSANFGEFRQFDYGKARNRFKYGSDEPPSYDLLSATSRIQIYHGGKDSVVTPAGVQLLVSKLPNATATLYPEYDHTDFFTQCTAPGRVYPAMIEVIKNAN